MGNFSFFYAQSKRWKSSCENDYLSQMRSFQLNNNSLNLTVILNE